MLVARFAVVGQLAPAVAVELVQFDLDVDADDCERTLDVLTDTGHFRPARQRPGSGVTADTAVAQL